MLDKSNYNPCYFGKNCKMQLGSAQLGLFETPEEGVFELPVTNFVEPTGKFRDMQITAVTLDEMKHCLRRYRALGVREVTLVTHSFEFYFLDSASNRRGHVNRVNVERLRGLCRYLSENAQDFEVDTVERSLAASRPILRRAARGSRKAAQAKGFPRRRCYQRALFEEGEVVADRRILRRSLCR